MKRSKFKIRTKQLKFVKASDLIAHPYNWRKHPEAQKSAFKGIIDEVGFAGALLTFEVGPGKYQIIDGHLRQEMTGNAEVPIIVTDLDADEAKLVLATHDPLAAMAETDAETLDNLIAGIETESKDVNALLTGLIKSDEEELEQPEFEFPEYDETTADDVKYITCPVCGEQIPK